MASFHPHLTGRLLITCTSCVWTCLIQLWIMKWRDNISGQNVKLATSISHQNQFKHESNETRFNTFSSLLFILSHKHSRKQQRPVTVLLTHVFNLSLFKLNHVLELLERRQLDFVCWDDKEPYKLLTRATNLYCLCDACRCVLTTCFPVVSCFVLFCRRWWRRRCSTVTPRPGTSPWSRPPSTVWRRSPAAWWWTPKMHRSLTEPTRWGTGEQMGNRGTVVVLVLRVVSISGFRTGS